MIEATVNQKNSALYVGRNFFILGCMYKDTYDCIYIYVLCEKVDRWG